MYIDIQKAFDSVKRKPLLKILKNYNPKKLIKQIKSTTKFATYQIKTKYRYTETHDHTGNETKRCNCTNPI